MDVQQLTVTAQINGENYIVDIPKDHWNLVLRLIAVVSENSTLNLVKAPAHFEFVKVDQPKPRSTEKINETDELHRLADVIGKSWSLVNDQSNGLSEQDRNDMRRLLMSQILRGDKLQSSAEAVPPHTGGYTSGGGGGLVIKESSLWLQDGDTAK